MTDRDKTREELVEELSALRGPVAESQAVEGENRRQIMPLPDCLDDYVTENNPVRVIEAFIDERDLTELGF